MKRALNFLPLAVLVGLQLTSLLSPAVVPNAGDALSFSQILFEMDGTERGWVAEARTILLVACAFLSIAITVHIFFLIGKVSRFLSIIFWSCALLGSAAFIVFHLGWISILDTDRAVLGNSWYIAYSSIVLMCLDRILLQKIIGKTS